MSRALLLRATLPTIFHLTTTVFGFTQKADCYLFSGTFDWKRGCLDNSKVKKIVFTAIRRRNTCWNSDLNWMEEMHELIHKTLLNGMGSCQWMLSTLRGVSPSIVNKLFCTTSLSKMALNFSVPCLVLACNSTHNSISPLLYVVLPERQTVLCPLFFPVIVENDHRERGSSPPISFS